MPVKLQSWTRGSKQLSSTNAHRQSVALTHLGVGLSQNEINVAQTQMMQLITALQVNTVGLALSDCRRLTVQLPQLRQDNRYINSYPDGNDGGSSVGGGSGGAGGGGVGGNGGYGGHVSSSGGCAPVAGMPTILKYGASGEGGAGGGGGSSSSGGHPRPYVLSTAPKAKTKAKAKMSGSFQQTQISSFPTVPLI